MGNWGFINSWAGLWLAIGALSACQNGNTATADAAPDRGRPDVSSLDNAGVTSLTVDFAVAGCPDFDPTVPRCIGRAPLRLEFIPVGTEGVTKYLWNFGDGTGNASEQSPIHTYSIPGSYTVSLVGGGSATGSAYRVREGFVVVESARTGEPCEVDAQCGQSLTCVCGSAARCSTAFVRGLCARTCETLACSGSQMGSEAGSEVCADLSVISGGPGATREPWQKALCLRACEGDSECPVGLFCRTLPGKSGWIKGCFPGFPRDAGQACRSAGGLLRHDACATGLCADLGARGICAANCTGSGCPAGTACALFQDGRALCLKACDTNFACDEDPLLACEAPNDGPLGFGVANASAETKYCAPKRCASSETCGPLGSCRLDGSNGHCAKP